MQSFKSKINKIKVHRSKGKIKALAKHYWLIMCSHSIKIKLDIFRNNIICYINLQFFCPAQFFKKQIISLFVLKNKTLHYLKCSKYLKQNRIEIKLAKGGCWKMIHLFLPFKICKIYGTFNKPIYAYFYKMHFEVKWNSLYSVKKYRLFVNYLFDKKLL